MASTPPPSPPPPPSTIHFSTVTEWYLLYENQLLEHYSNSERLIQEVQELSKVEEALKASEDKLRAEQNNLATYEQFIDEINFELEKEAQQMQGEVIFNVEDDVALLVHDKRWEEESSEHLKNMEMPCAENILRNKLREKFGDEIKHETVEILTGRHTLRRKQVEMQENIYIARSRFKTSKRLLAVCKKDLQDIMADFVRQNPGGRTIIDLKNPYDAHALRLMYEWTNYKGPWRINLNEDDAEFGTTEIAVAGFGISRDTGSLRSETLDVDV